MNYSGATFKTKGSLPVGMRQPSSEDGREKKQIQIYNPNLRYSFKC